MGPSARQCISVREERVHVEWALLPAAFDFVVEVVLDVILRFWSFLKNARSKI
jgi:hypothetical protein